MVDRFCGPGGNDGNSGLTWALRKLTLNGVEDTPVVAGDDCYIGPGVYRELLAVDVSGGAGTEISYIADVMGEMTDGVGGVVRITGSDNDQTAVRAETIIADTKDYRIFRGFHLDGVTSYVIDVDDCNNWTIEDCSYQNRGIRFRNNCNANLIRRLMCFGTVSGCIAFVDTGTQRNDTGNVIQNCVLFARRASNGISSNRIGGITIDNCVIINCGAGIIVSNLAALQTVDVGNCSISYCSSAINASALGMIIEDFNRLFGNTSDRVNTAVGGNSVSHLPLFELPLLRDEFGAFPWRAYSWSEWDATRALTDNGTGPADDWHGIARPVTNAKRSWGAIQFVDKERETGTVKTGSASLALRDAGRYQIVVPVDGAEMTIAVEVYRETNYGGTNPQLVVKQPGQADDTTTDAAGAAQWNTLTTTMTPAGSPGYVVVELISRNSGTVGSYETFFDDLTVS